MESAPTPQGLIQLLASAFQHGSIWIVLITASLAIGIAISVERFIRLYLQYNVNGASLMFEVQKYILANDIDGAIRHCNGAGNSAVARVIKAGLQRASRDEQQIQNAIDAASLETIPKLERRLPFLALIANVATLLGLLGTITGLIAAFASLERADPAQRQAMLSAGISEAMNATAIGLITAIFTMVCHGVLTAKANQILEEVDEFGVKLLDLLSARRFRSSSGGNAGQGNQA